MKIVHNKLKVHSLTGRITEELMYKAFKAVKKNRGAAGVERVSIGNRLRSPSFQELAEWLVSA